MLFCYSFSLYCLASSLFAFLHFTFSLLFLSSVQIQSCFKITTAKTTATTVQQRSIINQLNTRLIHCLVGVTTLNLSFRLSPFCSLLFFRLILCLNDGAVFFIMTHNWPNWSLIAEALILACTGSVTCCRCCRCCCSVWPCLGVTGRAWASLHGILISP